MDMTEENMQGEWESKKSIILDEVIHGCELAKDLENKLHSPSEEQHHLHQIVADSSAQIINTFKKVIELLGGAGNEGSGSEQGEAKATNTIKLSTTSEIPLRDLTISGNVSAQSSQKERPSLRNQAETSRRRKGFPRWTVRVPAANISDIGSDVPPDDGYTWRKYGQKDILGSQHPRSYYRCTHKTDMGCEAIRRVQRAYDDSSCFEVTYIGTHCCDTGAQFHNRFSVPPSSSLLLGAAAHSESSTSSEHGHVHALLPSITLSGKEVKEEMDKLPTGPTPFFSLYNPELFHMPTQLPNPTDVSMNPSGFGSRAHLQQDDTSYENANIFKEEKNLNLFDFLPPQPQPRPQPREGLDPAQYFGGCESSYMEVMDSRESVQGATCPMLDMDTMFQTDDVSELELQLGEKLPWNIKQP